MSVTRRWREVTLPVYSALIRPAVCPVLGSSVQERHVHTWASPWKVHADEKGLEHVSSDQWLKRLEPFSWKTVGGRHISVYEYLSRKAVRHWKGLPIEARSLRLEILKNATRTTCSRSLGFAQESCDRRSRVKPSNPNLPMILWTYKDQI